MCKIVSLVPSKNCHQRKLRQTKCLLFNFWIIKFTVIPKKPFGTWQFGKMGVLVNFVIQKLNTSFVSVFYGDRFFWWNERKYFTHISGHSLWTAPDYFCPQLIYNVKSLLLLLILKIALGEIDFKSQCHWYVSLSIFE